MRWAGHVARMGEERGCIGSWWGNRREGDHWEDLGVNVSMFSLYEATHSKPSASAELAYGCWRLPACVAAQKFERSVYCDISTQAAIFRAKSEYCLVFINKS